MQRRTVLASSMILPVLGCSTMSPQSIAPTSDQVALNLRLSSICNDAAKPLASLVVLSVRNGQVAYSAGFGRARIGAVAAKPVADDVLAGPDTLYRIASISKLITTLGVMRLVEAGRLNLDADVSDALGWPLRNPNFPNVAITLRQLLSHRSSLRDDAGYFWPASQNIREALTPGGSLFGKGEVWAKATAPGTFFQYANLPWGVIATVMERATGSRFDVLMQREVFGPLGIDGGFNPLALSPRERANLATLYRKRSTVNGKEVWNLAGPWVPQIDDYSAAEPPARAGADYVPGTNGLAFGPQGNARASVAGLGVIAQTLLAMGKAPNGTSFLKPDTVAIMLSRQWTFDATQKNGDNYKGLMLAWGLGNQQFLDVSNKANASIKDATGDRIVDSGGFTGYGHFGNAWGLTSALAINPKTQSALIYMIGGPAFDPDVADPGQYSSMWGYEERVLTALSRSLDG